MNLKENKYKEFSLIQDMLETTALVKKTAVNSIASFLPYIEKNKIFLTGEGSSRIFPAKKLIYDALRDNYAEHFVTENATQALEYDLTDYTVFVTSNSGKTKECIRLIHDLKGKDHNNILGVVANPDTPVLNKSNHGHILSCGPEHAVASTKSVIEQALFYDILFRKKNDHYLPDFIKLGELIEKVLAMKIPEEIISTVAAAEIIYFSGRNNGVAEELALKANEIARKKSEYLEGTYAVHGIEEVMQKNEVAIIIDPYHQEEEKFKEVLQKGIGLSVFAIATKQTIFPTIIIPEFGDFNPYLELIVGWNLLVEIGLRNGIDLDKPARARKIGNEFLE
ncbi:SIS domain-containing protein [Candidatus Margulisiibacteriota bacterium]